MIIDSHLHLSVKKGETFEKSAKKMLLNLKKNQIDKGIIIADYTLDYGCADLPTLLKYFGKNKDIYLIGAPNPFGNLTHELAKLEKSLKNREIIGLKIYPGHDKIRVDNWRLDQVYQFCSEQDVPIIIHTGINTGDLKAATYNDPKYIVKIAQKYPKLKIVIAHYFWPKLDYCYEITNGIENIYFDISGLADITVYKPSGGIDKVKMILEKTIERKPDSVLFGSDYQGGDILDHKKLINSLDIDRELREKIFSKNAIEVFKIDNYQKAVWLGGFGFS